MKKLVLIFLGLIASFYSHQVLAQGTFTMKDTVNVSLNGQMNVYNDIMNNTSSPVKYTWTVTATDFPATWQDVNAVGICDNVLCRQGISLMKSYTTNDVDAGKALDFHLQMNLENATPGTHYMVINVTDGVNDTDAVFILNKFPTGVSTVKKAEDAISIYPNPARTELNVLFSSGSNIKNIAVCNLIGKPVVNYKVTSPNSAKLNLENIPSGVYFVRLIDGQGRVSAIRKFTHL